MTDTIIVTGADGMLGRQVVRAGFQQRLAVIPLAHSRCDITNVTQVGDHLRPHPDAVVINCAGIVRGQPEGWMDNVNGRGPHVLARFAGRLVQVSTDCVFDGKLTGDTEGYTESSPATTSDRYSQTKLQGEVTDGPHLTVRGSFIGLGQFGLIRWLLDHPQGAEVPGYLNWYWNGSYVDAEAEQDGPGVHPAGADGY